MYLKVIILIVSLLYLLLLKQQYKQVGTLGYENARKRYAVFVAILLILQSGLRHLYVGPDTIQYYSHFCDDIKLSWKDVFYNFFNVYQYGEGKDAGYAVIEKLFSLVSVDYQCYLLFVATAIFTPMIILVYKNTKRIEDIWFALLMYYALFYHFFSVTGIRQTLATALCLVSYKYIKERRLFVFSAIIIIAAFIHKTALIFFPFFWISEIRKVKMLFLIVTLSFPIMTVIGYEFTTYLALLSGSENYIGYADEGSRGAFNLILFYFIIGSITFLKFRKSKDFLEENKSIFNAFSMGLFLFPLSFNSPNLVRLVQYYSIFVLIFMGFINIPQSKYHKNMILFLLISALVYKIIGTSDEYAFFWEYYVPKLY